MGLALTNSSQPVRQTLSRSIVAGGIFTDRVPLANPHGAIGLLADPLVGALIGLTLTGAASLLAAGSNTGA